MPTLYLDCDGFFAACEEASDSSLHGRPVAVSTTAPDNPGACLIGVNIHAKRLGAGKGEIAREAGTAVPDLVIRPQRPERYVAVHHAIARAVDSVIPASRSRSIDELSVDLCPTDHPETILARVKDAIREAVGPIITVSCAIAPSSFLAKTAAEANKPDAAVVWNIEDIPRIYAGLELADLPGLGPRTEVRLRKCGIDSVLALYHAEPALVRSAWGSVVGRYVQKQLHGENPLFRESPRRRISHGRVLEPRLRTWDAARPIMRFLVICTLHRCTREGAAPSKLWLEIIGVRGRLWTQGASVRANNHEAEALRELSARWDAIASKAREYPMRFSVVASGLVEWPARQGELFEHPRGDLQATIDRVRNRFGCRALTLGETRDPARYTGLKISFEHIPDRETFAWLGVKMPEIGPTPGT